MERALLLLLGVSIPFPLLGVPLNEAYTLPLAGILGAWWAFLRTAHTGLGKGHAWGLLFIAAFLATAAFRHPVSSYALSIGALTLAILPLTARLPSPANTEALLLGVKIGLAVTLTLEFALIAVQLLPGRLPLEDILPENMTRSHGDFLGYNRPAAGFNEPSHLAIYLSACFALQDLLPQKVAANRTLVKGLLALAVLLTGSLSGVAILVLYVAARGLASLLAGRRRTGQPRRFGPWLAALAVASLVAIVLQDSLAEALDSYVQRILQAQQDIALDNLMSSEGSRLFAFLALLDFWDTSGALGLMLGTGYGNYRDFLAQMYGNLSEVTSFGRGDIDNMLVAVLLSTGLFGGLAYVAFTVRQFAGTGLQVMLPVLTLLLAINFSYGFLISPLYWDLMLMLAAAAAARGTATPSAAASARP
jgi:hypothetical protein